MKPLVFYFNFSIEETETEKTLGFIVENPKLFYISLGYSNYKQTMGCFYEDVAEELESEYGVHDWSSAPSKEVDAIGYTTYEVLEEYIPDLMSAWRQKFLDAGCNVTEIINIPLSISVKQDKDIYDYIKSIK